MVHAARENSRISISPLSKVHPRGSVFLRRSHDGDELTLRRETRRIRVLIIYEHATIQTPSCLGSLVNPRIAYIPSRFIAARTFFFLFPLRLALSRSLPLSSFLPSRQPLSLSSKSPRILAAWRHRQGSNVKNERDATREKRDSGAEPCKNFGLPSFSPWCVSAAFDLLKTHREPSEPASFESDPHRRDQRAEYNTKPNAGGAVIRAGALRYDLLTQ